MIEHLEDLANARHIFEKLKTTKEFYKKDKYLELIARQAKAKQKKKGADDKNHHIPLP